jgi:hypothetical protein
VSTCLRKKFDPSTAKNKTKLIVWLYVSPEKTYSKVVVKVPMLIIYAFKKYCMQVSDTVKGSTAVNTEVTF